MTNIKVNSEGMSNSVINLRYEIENYENAVVNSQVQLNSAFQNLSGRGYNALDKQLEEAINKQKTVVAECQLLIQAIQQYLVDIVNEEEKIKFPE